MHVKEKYISAISDAIDFLISNTDGASDEHSESETIQVLGEILKKMEDSQHKKRVSYYVRKHEDRSSEIQRQMKMRASIRHLLKEHTNQ